MITTNYPFSIIYRQIRVDDKIETKIKLNKLKQKINDKQTKKSNQIQRWYLDVESP